MARSGAVRWELALVKLLINAQVESPIQHAEELVTEPKLLRVNSVTTPWICSRQIEDLKH